MDEKSKLFVFDKKEVALIFLFMILIAVTSFIFGVKIGKNYSYSLSGLTAEERQKVDMLSTQEEEVKGNLEKEHVAPTGEHGEPTKEGGVPEDQTYKKLEEEFNKLNAPEGQAAGQEPKEENAHGEAATEQAPATSTHEAAPATHSAPEKEATAEESSHEIESFKKSSKAEKPISAPVKDKYVGKYTIQLGSHRSIKEAEDFANGFRIRGYNPIINEVEIANKGIWYRVSLGVFGSVSEAKDYIIKEKSLFQGQDYVIGKFD